MVGFRDEERRPFLRSGEGVPNQDRVIHREVPKVVFADLEKAKKPKHNFKDNTGEAPKKVYHPDPRNPHVDQETGEYIPHKPSEDDSYHSRQVREINSSLRKGKLANSIIGASMGVVALGVASLVHFRDDIRDRFHVIDEKPIVVEQTQVTREVPKRIDQSQYVKGSFERLKKAFETNDVNNFVWSVPQGIGELETRVEQLPGITDEKLVELQERVGGVPKGNWSRFEDPKNALLNSRVPKVVPKNGQGLGEIVWAEVLKVAYPASGRNEILYGQDGLSGLTKWVAEQNGLKDVNSIVAGQELLVDVRTGLNVLGYGSLLEREDLPEQLVYDVKQGDNLTRIAENIRSGYRVNNSVLNLVNILCEVNGIDDCNKIYPGQRLTLPVDALMNNEVSLLEEIGKEYATGVKVSEIARKTGMDTKQIVAIGSEYARDNGIMFTRFDYRRHDVSKLSDEAKELYALSGNKTKVQRELTRRYGKMSWHTADKLIKADYEVLKVA